jgi:hypothetical protein
MATMRNGLETWLKQDCVDKLNPFMDASYLIQTTKSALIAIELFSRHDPNFPMLDEIQNSMVTLEMKLKDKGLMNPVVQKALSMYPINVSATLDVCDEVFNAILINSAENMVECQCGKYGSGKHHDDIVNSTVPDISEEKILKDIFPEHGKVVNYIDSKGREVKLVARPIWTDYEDEKAYQEDLTAWESNGESTLGGRITNPDVANTGSCTCTAGKEMCWHHGVQGTLTKDQKEAMCKVWNPIKQEGK